MSGRRFRGLAVGGLALVLGLRQDSIVRVLGPENDPQTVIHPREVPVFRHGSAKRERPANWTWTNPAPQASLASRQLPASWLRHPGRPDAGVVVDSTLLELNLDTETRVGAPGNWTLILVLASARGRADFTLTPKTPEALAGRSRE